MDLKCWIRIRNETNSDPPQHSFESTEKSFSPDQKIKNVAGSMNLKRQVVKKQCEAGCECYDTDLSLCCCGLEQIMDQIPLPRCHGPIEEHNWFF